MELQQVLEKVGPQTLTMQSTVDAILQEVRSQVPCIFLRIARLTLACHSDEKQKGCQKESVSDLSKGIFGGLSDLESMLSYRAVWILEALNALATGQHKVTNEDTRDLIQCLRHLRHE